MKSRKGNKPRNFSIPEICKSCNSRFCDGDQYNRYKECPCATCLLLTICDEECDEFSKFLKTGLLNLEGLRRIKIPLRNNHY